VTVIEIQHNRIGWPLGPAMLRLDLRRADHSGPLPPSGRRPSAA
jgi:hypothetical protein